MKKVDTKALVEASLFTALAAVIMIISAYVPFFALLGVILWPIPITLLTFKYDFKLSLLSLTAVLIIVSGIVSPLSALSMGLIYGVPAVVLGFCLRRKYSPLNTVIAMALAMFMAYIAILKLSVLITGIDILKQFYEIIDESFKITQEMAKGFGLDEVQLQQYMANGLDPNILKESVRLTLPGLLALASLMGSYFNYYFTGVIFKKLRIDINGVKPMDQWYISTSLSIGLFLVTIASWVMYYLNVANADVVYSSVFVIFSFIFAVNGFALLSWFLKVRGVPPKARVAIIVVLYFMGFSQIMFYIGLIDYIFDFRKVNPTRRRIPPGE